MRTYVILIICSKWFIPYTKLLLYMSLQSISCNFYIYICWIIIKPFLIVAVYLHRRSSYLRRFCFHRILLLTLLICFRCYEFVAKFIKLHKLKWKMSAQLLALMSVLRYFETFRELFSTLTEIYSAWCDKIKFIFPNKCCYE